MHATIKPDATSQPTATLVFDEVLDATSCSAMRRFQKRARRAPHCEASIDLRRTRAVGAGAWATLVKAVCDLKRSGHEVTGLARHARIVIVQI